MAIQTELAAEWFEGSTIKWTWNDATEKLTSIICDNRSSKVMTVEMISPYSRSITVNPNSQFTLSIPTANRPLYQIVEGIRDGLPVSHRSGIQWRACLGVF